jgi:hypothetical protein
MGTKTKISPGAMRTSSLISVFRRDLEFISSIKRGLENKELSVFIFCKFPILFLERISKKHNKTSTGVAVFLFF